MLSLGELQSNFFVFFAPKILLNFNSEKLMKMRIFYYKENITWLRGNMKFISSVEQDISRVSEANEWDILLTREIILIFPSIHAIFCSQRKSKFLLQTKCR